MPHNRFFSDYPLPTVQGPNLDCDEQGRMQAFHDETRFHRGAQRRRSRIVKRYLTDPATVRKAAETRKPTFGERIISLGSPDLIPSSTLGDLLLERSSTSRRHLQGALTQEVVSDLLWLAARSTRQATSPIVDAKFALRPYPSAGALYPCELFVVLGGEGSYNNRPLRYDPCLHALIDFGAGVRDFRSVEMEAAGIAPPPCAIVITGQLERSMAKYGPRGYKFALLEAGHIAQNLILAATALDLTSLVSGSYYDLELEQWLGLDGRNDVVLSLVLLGGRSNPDGI